MKLIVKTLALGTALFMTACGTHQKVDNAMMLSPGMSKTQVVQVMGSQPAKAEFSGNVEEWHYCSTGSSSDEFVAVFFHDGQVIAMRPYLVTINDAGVSGTCERFVRMGNYREPSVVREYRFR